MPSVATGATQKCICCQCGENLPPTQFFKSYSSLFAGLGHLPICKSCLIREYKKYKIEYKGSDQRAMQRICMAFDIYFDPSLFDTCNGNDDTRLGIYMRKINLGQYKGRTFDTTMAEGFFFTGEKEKIDMVKKVESEETPIDPHLIQKWGEGLSQIDYTILEEHYKYLKSANPNCDSNQEIFIIDLCYTKMQQMRAVRSNSVDDFNKLTESYRRTFTQAGLKTVQDANANSEDCWGVWQERIAQYTPEEYYKNKKLYRDFDGIGEYFERFVLRPLRNLMYGTQDRDPEFCVNDCGDEHDDEFAES